MGVFKEMTRTLSFESYVQFRKSRSGKNFLYILVLSLICWLLTVVVSWGIFFAVHGAYLMESIPYFSMSSEGIFTVEESIDETDDNDRIVIDTSYEYSYDPENGNIYRNLSGVSEFFMNADDYGQFFVIGSNSVIVNTDDLDEVFEYQYSDIPVRYLEMINTGFLISVIKKIIIIVGIIAFFFIFIRLTLWNIVNGVLAAVIGSGMGMRNSFGQLYSMALRAYTPVYLVCCIASAAGFGIPFKTIICLVVTGIILAKAMKVIRETEESNGEIITDIPSDRE